jgi:putative transposase
VSAYIEAHRDRFGVEPICRALQVAPSTHYARRNRPPSARALADARLEREIERVHEANYRVYGADKVWAQLRREGFRVARCTVERLMRRLGIRGALRGKPARTTIPAKAGPQPADLVDRDFAAPAPNRLWVADITYCRTFSGFVFAAFIVDCFSRRVVGWQMARHLRTDLALDALEMAIWARRADLSGLVHHADRGSQYLAIRYTERLADAGAVASVGSRGDSYDNALAESFIGLFKTELVRNRGPFRGQDDLEIAALEWIDWYNHRRLHGELGMSPPAEFEERFIAESHGPCGPAEADRPALLGGAPAGLGKTGEPIS